MTPEERFERIETQLELLARYGVDTADRLDGVTDRLNSITDRLNSVADRLDRLAERVEGLAEAQRGTQASVDQTSRDVAKLVDVVGSLVRRFERHSGDGHGGRE